MKVRARRRLEATPEQLWTTVRDPARLPRWWPLVVRVEAVSRFGFTEVLVSKRGREVRADFHVTGDEKPVRRGWELELRDSPFARIFHSSRYEVRLEDEGSGATRVTIEHAVTLNGANRLGAPLIRRSTKKTLRAALDGLEAEAAREVAG